MKSIGSTDANKATVRAFVDAINAKDWARLAALVAPGFTRHSYAAGSEVRNRDEFLQFLRSELESFPDAQEVLVDLIAEGNKVAARHRFRGTQLGALGVHPPSGKVMQSEYIAIYRLEAGLIVEAWAEWDNQAGLAQLGHV